MPITIIYDFDGTLVDSGNLITDIFASLGDEFKLKNLNSNQLKSYREKSIRQLIKELGISPLQLPKLIHRAQVEMGHRLNQLNWHQDIRLILFELNQAKTPQGIVTSNSINNVQSFLKLKPCEVFEFIHSGKNLFGKDKVLSVLLKKQQLDLDSTIYIGDEVRDIEACHKIGMKIIAVDWGFDSKNILSEAQPNFLISQPKEIIKIINTLS